MDKSLCAQIPGGVQWGSNGEGQIRCPYHDDKNPSCSINIEKETFICHACGKKGKLGMLLERCGLVHAGNGQTEYDYLDAEGVLKYQAVRFYKDGQKCFFVRQPNGSGDWVNNLKGIDFLPYNLPGIIEGVKKGRPVIIVEGEKDADRLNKIGGIATTNHGGAGKWRACHAKFLKDTNVFLIADYDVPGQKHIEQVGKSLTGIAKSIKVIDLGFEIVSEHGKDISDWLDSHTKEELQHLINTAKPLNLSPPSPPPKGEVGALQKTASGKSIDNFALTDIGNAERFYGRFGAELHYCTVLKEWFTWTGTVWQADENQIVAKWAKKISREMYNEAWEAKSKRLSAHAIKTANRSRLDAMVEVAKSEESIPVLLNEFDKHPYLWNTLKGTIDLKNVGEVGPNDKSKLITMISPVGFDPEAAAPRWNKFLMEIMGNDSEMVAFLSRMFGYAMTGCTYEQKFFILWGLGRNGKTKLMETIGHVFGDYTAVALQDTFLAKKQENIQHDIARLRKARMVCVSETGKYSKLDLERVKQWVGEDEVSGRFLYQKKGFDFHPAGKLLIRTNYKPGIRETVAGIWRKALLIPFTERFEGTNDDKHLQEKLDAELPGILNWCIGGCMAWQREGLNPPDKVLAAVKEYRGEEDDLLPFFNKHYIDDPKSETVLATAVIYDKYALWCEGEGIKKPISKKWFGRALSERGYTKADTMSERGWKGLKPVNL